MRERTMVEPSSEFHVFFYVTHAESWQVFLRPSGEIARGWEQPAADGSEMVVFHTYHSTNERALAHVREMVEREDMLGIPRKVIQHVCT